WMKIWWTNSNPRLILSYYLDRVQALGGTENYGLANGPTMLRHLLNPSLEGTLQPASLDVKEEKFYARIG
ncbi:hypothetical protein B0H14DRAFT_2358505, partial [Mycena olivaceomarginata]